MGLSTAPRERASSRARPWIRGTKSVSVLSARSVLALVEWKLPHLDHTHSDLVRGVQDEDDRLSVLVVLFPQTAILVGTGHVEDIEAQAPFLELFYAKANRGNRRFLVRLRFQPLRVAHETRKARARPGQLGSPAETDALIVSNEAEGSERSILPDPYFCMMVDLPLLSRPTTRIFTLLFLLPKRAASFAKNPMV